MAAAAAVTGSLLLTVGCSSSNSSSGSTSGNTGSGTNWATASSISAGGMNALVAAAKKEGTLNVIALPPTWANYGAILSAFTAKYGIKINSTLPDGSSQQEVDAVKSQHGTAKAPDVLDVGMAVALANTKLFAPYKVSTWGDIPSAQKDPGGLWYQDYGGYMAIGYSSKFGTITSLNDLLSPKFKGAVALNGNPTSANAALNAVMMVNLAEGGTPSDIVLDESRRRLYLVNAAANRVDIWDYAAKVLIGSIDVGLRPLAGALSMDTCATSTRRATPARAWGAHASRTERDGRLLAGAVSRSWAWAVGRGQGR